MILMTGAAGKTGLAVLSALQQQGRKIRAFVRHDEQIAAVRNAGAAEVVVGNLLDADVWRLATTAVADIFSQQLNRPVEVQSIPLETWQNNARAAGNMSKETIQMLSAMFATYAQSGLTSNPQVLRFSAKLCVTFLTQTDTL